MADEHAARAATRTSSPRARAAIGPRCSSRGTPQISSNAAQRQRDAEPGPQRSGEPDRERHAVAGQRMHLSSSCAPITGMRASAESTMSSCSSGSSSSTNRARRRTRAAAGRARGTRRGDQRREAGATVLAELLAAPDDERDPPVPSLPGIDPGERVVAMRSADHNRCAASEPSQSLKRPGHGPSMVTEADATPDLTFHAPPTRNPSLDRWRAAPRARRRSASWPAPLRMSLPVVVQQLSTCWKSGWCAPRRSVAFACAGSSPAPMQLLEQRHIAPTTGATWEGHLETASATPAATYGRPAA